MTRFEMRIEDALLERIDRERGDTPRATFIKRILEGAVGVRSEKAPGAPVKGVVETPAGGSTPQARPPASSRAGSRAVETDAMARQRKMNEAKARRS